MATGGSAFLSAAVHDAVALRQGGADLLPLALMDARNRTLGWLRVFEGLDFSGRLMGLEPPLWLMGQVAWQQDFWVARHVQRNRGLGADPQGMRLAPLDAEADRQFDARNSTPAERWAMPQPEPETLRQYLGATLDATLELLERAGPDASALHVFHQVLHAEDLAGEQLAELAQALDLPPARHALAAELGLWADWASPVRRDAVGLPGGTVRLGAEPDIWAPEAERWAHDSTVAAFEIDAQAVSWAQWAEFVDDGGYDQQAWWTPDGWDWLEAMARRAPRYVEQLAGGVLARRQGRLQRLPPGQPVVHVTAHEADAWCRWAGRRLPSDAEWTAAARGASARGWRWGDVLEWVAGSARAYPGGPTPPVGSRVLRGGQRSGQCPAAACWGTALCAGRQRRAVLRLPQLHAVRRPVVARATGRAPSPA